MGRGVVSIEPPGQGKVDETQDDVLVRQAATETTTTSTTTTTTATATTTATTTTTTTAIPLSCFGDVEVDPDDTVASLTAGVLSPMPIRVTITSGFMDLIVNDGGAGGSFSGFCSGVPIPPGELPCNYTPSASPPAEIAIRANLTPHSLGFTCGPGSTGDFDEKLFPVTTPCQGTNPLTSISTFAKGGSAANNATVSTEVTGNIIGAGSLGPTENRIPVCAGTSVSTAITDTSGTPTITKSSGGLSCSSSGCTGTISATEKYTVQSANGNDTDTLTFLPQ